MLYSKPVGLVKGEYGGGGVLHTLLQVTVIVSFFNHLLNSPHIYPHTFI